MKNVGATLRHATEHGEPGAQHGARFGCCAGLGTRPAIVYAAPPGVKAPRVKISLSAALKNVPARQVNDGYSVNPPLVYIWRNQMCASKPRDETNVHRPADASEPRRDVRTKKKFNVCLRRFRECLVASSHLYVCSKNLAASQLKYTNAIVPGISVGNAERARSSRSALSTPVHPVEYVSGVNAPITASVRYPCIAHAHAHITIPTIGRHRSSLSVFHAELVRFVDGPVERMKTKRKRIQRLTQVSRRFVARVERSETVNATGRIVDRPRTRCANGDAPAASIARSARWMTHAGRRRVQRATRARRFERNREARDGKSERWVIARSRTTRRAMDLCTNKLHERIVRDGVRGFGARERARHATSTLGGWNRKPTSTQDRPSSSAREAYFESNLANGSHRTHPLGRANCSNTLSR